MKQEREEVEMVDGRLYFSTDNWATVWQSRGLGRSHRKVLDKEEADLIRYLAVVKYGGGRDEAR